MASIRKRINSKGKVSYHVQIRISGHPPLTQTFDKKTDAENWAKKAESEINDGRLLPQKVAQKRLMSELIEEYRTNVLIPLKPKRVRDQGPQLTWWKEKLGRYNLQDVSPALIGKCRDELLSQPFVTPTGKEKKRTPATVLRYMALLSHVFNVAVKEWEWLAESPMSRVKKPKVSNNRIRYLSADELERLRTQAARSENPYLLTVLEVAVGTGMRYSEIMTLRWRNVLFEGDTTALVLLEQTKNSEPRGVPLAGKAFETVRALRDAHKKANHGKVNSAALLFPSTRTKDRPVQMRKSWETALERAGIEHFRFHDLRHTTASYLAMEGATAPEIAEVLGHKDLQMVKRYAHLSKAHISKVLEKMHQSRLGAAPAKQKEADDGTA